MAVRKQFTVSLENKPGQLARLCKALARAKVNILAVSVADNADSGDVRFVCDRAGAARQALKKAKINAWMRDVLVLSLPNEPGALAGVSAKLAAAGINIDYVYGSTAGEAGEIVLAVSDTAKAASVLA